MIKLYSKGENYKLYLGNMLDMLEAIEKNSIDAVLTDPPYELNFMNKGWDNSGVAFQKDTWRKCYEVLKPGGYLLAFGGSRTFHRIACAIEDAGFEIRDTIMWLYGSGFPKSMNIGLAIDKKNGVDNRTGNIRTDGACNGKHFDLSEKVSMTQEFEERIAQNEWAGWGTALKPSYEPVIVARKPCEGSCIDNVLKWGVGGLNIDECRVPFNGDMWQPQKSGSTSRAYQSEETTTANGMCEANANGRYPSNTILTYDETDYDEVCGGMPNTKSAASGYNFERTSQNNPTHLYTNIKSGVHFDDEGSAARYFYCAKASRRDRDDGLEDFEEQLGGSYNFRLDGSLDGNIPSRRNIHPTVKPTELMQYLVRLVTPRGGTVLDPFNGSGSTGKAAMYENKDRDAEYKYIGIELTEEYLPIAKARIEYAINDKSLSDEQKKFIEEGQMTLF